jgi:hypothetical protein
MAKVEYFEPEIVSLKSDPELGEPWLQDRIAENPKILGPGELVLRDKERPQHQREAPGFIATGPWDPQAL